jgi:uncharacterized protein
MSMSFKSEVDAPRPEVFAWHGRPGAIVRLLPPWAPVRVEAEAQDLRSGRAVLRLAGLWPWVAQHQADGYQPPESFADVLVSAPRDLVRWRHTHLFNALDPDRTEVADRVETNVPPFAVRQMFAYRHRQLAGDLAVHQWAARLGASPMTVAVTGSSGLIGTALRALLTTGGHRVVRLVRGAPSGPDERHWGPASPGAELFEGVDAVVHLAGKPIFGRFTPEHKEAAAASRLGPTRRLAAAAGQAKRREGRPATFVCASAVGYYGPDRGDEVLTEGSSKGDGFLADLVEQWEASAQVAADDGVRVVNVRTGIVQSPRGGMLKLLYPLFLAGGGGRLGRGDQWVAWVGIDDLVDVYLRALVDSGVRGPVNAVAPGAVTNREYTATLARVLRRPALLAVPSWGPRLALGTEGAREFGLAGQRAKPAVLEAAGHQFRHPGLEQALRHLLGRWGPVTGPGPVTDAAQPEPRAALVL